jgi:hypothetical protein
LNKIKIPHEEQPKNPLKSREIIINVKKMKKQNAINKLAFAKAAVAELNGVQMTKINGGTIVGGGCFLCVNSSKGHNIDEFIAL